MRYTGGYHKGTPQIIQGPDALHHHRLHCRFYDLCVERGYTHPNGALRIKKLVELLDYDVHTIHKLAYNPFAPNLSAMLILTICYAFQCQPGDLLTYIPGKERLPARRRYQTTIDYTDLGDN